MVTSNRVQVLFPCTPRQVLSRLNILESVGAGTLAPARAVHLLGVLEEAKRISDRQRARTMLAVINSYPNGTAAVIRASRRCWPRSAASRASKHSRFSGS